MTVNSFFSGIGGFDLGFQKKRFKVQYQCEINKFCIEILKKHWPTVSRATDISAVDPAAIPDADIWCGGFPCQDVSVARGSMGREGLKGKNSGLFYPFIELIRQKRPEIILIENVTGLLNSHNGNDFKIILESLTQLGYGVSWRVFNTRYFGAPQSRPRVYICAWRNSLEKAVFALHEHEASVKPNNPRTGFLTPHPKPGTTIRVPEVAYCLAATSGRHTGTDWSRTYISYSNRVRRLTPSEAEKLQGFPPEWTIPADAAAKKSKDLDAMRYHAIGNAVSVPVVVWIADRINRIREQEIRYRGVHQVVKKFSDFNTDKARTQFYSDLNDRTLFENPDHKIKWFSGGLAYGDEIVDCAVHHCPTDPLNSQLVDIIDDETPDDKYFISPGAATGILRRVASQERVLFGPLATALRRMAATVDAGAAT
jgi:DNA (cytosine-5)-methyltransferase 1